MRAVDCLAHKRWLAEWWDSDHGLRGARAVIEVAQDMPDVVPADAAERERSAEALRDVARRHLRVAETYHCTDRMTDLAELAAESLPEAVLSVDDPPSPAGFLVLDHAVGGLRVDEMVRSEEDMTIVRQLGASAFAWGPMTNPGDGKPGLMIAAFVHIDALRARVAYWNAEELALERSIAEQEQRILDFFAEHDIDPDNLPAERPELLTELAELRLKLVEDRRETRNVITRSRTTERAIRDWRGTPYLLADVAFVSWGATLVSEQTDLPLRALVSVWALMRQTLTVVGHERAPRPELRRLRRANLPDTGVTVVELRQRRYVGGERDGEERSVEWNCRWLVRGHWRMQPYKDGRVERIWIQPFVKGPEDKPLRRVEHVYDLRR